MNLTEKLANRTMELIYSIAFLNLARKNSKDFTRKRKMTFEEVVLFMLISLKSSTQCALRRFFSMIGKSVTIKQQSFSEARTKIKVEAFIALFRETAIIMTANCHKKWHGFRVYGVDGSKIALPDDKKLLGRFGAVGRNSTSPTAQGSIIYDVLNDIVADALIGPVSADERTLAELHLDKVNEISPDEKKLVIFDRGYPSFELIEKLENEGFHYVMRVRSKFNVKIDVQTSPDGYVWLEKGGKRIHTRVVKFCLDSGELEVLITNIADKRLGVKEFKKLYFMRWPVEIKYDVVKNKLQIENFSSRTVEGVQQDFYAAMYLTNIAAAAAIDAQPDVELARKDKNNKHQYRVNVNELIGVLKDRFVAAVINGDSDKQATMIQNIIDEVKLYVVPVRPDRSVVRNPTPRKVKFHHNQRANC